MTVSLESLGFELRPINPTPVSEADVVERVAAALADSMLSQDAKGYIRAKISADTLARVAVDVITGCHKGESE